MNDGFAWWLVVLGIAVGVALVWLVVTRLPRDESDVGEAEREVEAAWISRTIGAYGGLAPEPLVEEVLELHQHYLASTSGQLQVATEDEVEEETPEPLPDEGGADAEAPGDRVSTASEPARRERSSVGPVTPGP